MAVQFSVPDVSGPLRQGEVLLDIWEHRPLVPPDEVDENFEISLNSELHGFVVAMSPDCDLNQDFAARFPNSYPFPDESIKQRFIENPDRYKITHVLLCDALLENEFRSDLAGGDIFRRAKQNQNERYHRLGPGVLDVRDDDPIKIDVFLDFKRTFTVPLDMLYESILNKNEKRHAVLLSPYLEDLVHRFNCFQSRVALPS